MAIIVKGGSRGGAFLEGRHRTPTTTTLERSKGWLEVERKRVVVRGGGHL